MSETYVGRKWVCDCGWKGSQYAAYEHAANDCDDERPRVGPRYHPDPYREGKQAGLDRWGIA